MKLSRNNVYNATFKEKFLQDIVTNDNSLAGWNSFFNKVTMTESKLNKDLYQFNAEELMSLFIDNNWITNSSFALHRNQIAKYFDYAVDNNLLSMDDALVCRRIKYENINMDNEIKKKYYLNFKEYIKDFDKTYINHDYYLITRYKCMMALFWFGIPKEDMPYLTLDDVDFKNDTIFCKSINRKIKVDSIVTTLCNTIATLKYYTAKNNTKLCLPETNNIIKNKNSEEENQNDMINNILINFHQDFNIKFDPDYKNPDINYRDKKFMAKQAQINGRFERAWQQEQKGAKFTNSKEYKDFVFIDARDTINALPEYKTYLYWKKAYGLER